jgi:predicted phage terminase large subunit-like protein
VTSFSSLEQQTILRSDYGAFLQKVFNTLNPGQPFIPSWYIDAIAHALERVRRGEIRRLIINMPPRSLKSIAASVAFPAFLLGHDPTKRIVCVSYSGDLSRKMSNDFRAILDSPWYRDLFPRTRVGQFKDSEGEIELTLRGLRLATSVGGTLTGRGGDIIIIDDPLKPQDAQSDAKRAAVIQWYSNTLLSRLDNKLTGAIIIVMQRVHMDDLTGFVLQQSDDWEVLSLPAIADSAQLIPLPYGNVHRREIGDVLSPEREPLHELESLKQKLGSSEFSAQYQQAPVPPGGAMIKRNWVKRYAELPTDRASMRVVQSWDTACKGGPDNDWSVCTTWHVRGAIYHLVDVYRDRVNYPDLKRKVVELAQMFDADQVLVEDAGTAMALIAELHNEVRGLTAVKPDRDKQTRMSIASAKFESGQVVLPERAPWLADLESELFAFPGSRHDDQVDSISQALNHNSDFIDYAKVAENAPEFMRRLDRILGYY